MNSISPPKENKTLSCCRYEESKISENEKKNKIKKTNSIKTIFLYSKNKEISKKIDNDIKTNLNINNINGGKTFKYFQNNISQNSQKFGDEKTIDSYYDSIETETIEKKNNNKTINVSDTTSNFRKKGYIKPNNNNHIKKVLYINKNNDNVRNGNISKIKPRSNSKKIVKKISSNKSILKIPKNIPEHINTSKYISIKGKNIPNLNRYNSLKQLINEKNRIKINTNKENEQFNKTFSKITNTDNMSSNTRSSTNNDNKNPKIIVKNFNVNKIFNYNFWIFIIIKL